MNDSRFFLLVQLTSSIVKGFLWLAALCVLGYFIKEILIAYSGKMTFANVHISFLMGLNIWSKLTLSSSLLFGFFGISYGRYWRSVAKREIEHMGTQNKNLEQVLNPSRKTSKINSDGSTRKEDKI